MTRTASRSTDRSTADAELIAWLLDNSIPIPGTRHRFGLDAIIGLVPGLGDILSSGLGLLIVARAAQRGLPNIVLARMLANVALDFVVGAIPLLGDAFDFWFKSNARNIALLRRYGEDPTASTSGQWAFFIGLVVAIGAVAAGITWLIWSALSALFA